MPALAILLIVIFSFIIVKKLIDHRTRVQVARAVSAAEIEKEKTKQLKLNKKIVDDWSEPMSKWDNPDYP